MSTNKPSGFICESCGRASYNMALAPTCAKCRSGVPVPAVPDWVDAKFEERRNECRAALNIYLGRETEETFRGAFYALQAYGRMRGWR